MTNETKKDAPTYLEYNGNLLALIPDPERPGVYTLLCGDPLPTTWREAAPVLRVSCGGDCLDPSGFCYGSCQRDAQPNV